MNAVITFVASYFIYILAIAFFAFWLFLNKSDRKRMLILVLASGILALLIAKVASMFYFDPRPFTHAGVKALIPHSADNGFPSDHTLLAALLAACACYFNRYAGLSFLVVAIAIGEARVAAHVHSPIDILASLIISTFAVICVAYFQVKLLDENSKKILHD